MRRNSTRKIPEKPQSVFAKAIVFSSALTAFLYFSVCCVRFVSSDIAETRGQEPLIITGVMKILSGSSLYTHPNSPPCDLIQYTPLYYYLAAYASEAAGYLTGDPEYVTRIGRILSSVFAVTHLVVFAILCVRVLRIRPLFMIAAAAFVWVVHAPWDFLARPDALVSLCFVSAMALALAGVSDEVGDRSALMLFASASALGFLAFMAKQNGAQIVVVLIAYSLWRRKWLQSAVVAAIPTALLALTVIAGPHWFGDFYTENAVGGLNNGVRLYPAFVSTYIPVFAHFSIAPLVALTVYAMHGWLRRNATQQKQFMAVAFILTFALAALSASKLGSAPNHYCDFMTLLAMTLAFWLEEVSRNSAERAIAAHRGVAAFTILFFSTQCVAFRENFVNKPWRHFKAYEEIASYMRNEVGKHPDDQFISVDYTFANYFPERVVIPQFSLSCIMYARGLVDFSAVQDMMNTGKVRWLLFGPEQDIDRQLGFVGLTPKGYMRADTVGGFGVWAHTPDSENGEVK